MKILSVISFLILSSISVFSQQKTVEQIVADTACACLSKLDVNLQKEKLAAQADNCMQQAIEKNESLIVEGYSFDEENAYTEGVQFGQAIAQKVFVILANECKEYQPIFIKLSKKN